MRTMPSFSARARAAAVAACALAAACGGDSAARTDSAAASDSPAAAAATTAAPSIAFVPEAFVTPFDTAGNVDSPAVWHGPNGQHWLIATEKSQNVLLVNDAATGAPIRRVGGSGTARGQMMRPNGVAVMNDVVMVVERDNHRVQAFRLPAFTPLGTFGDTLLTKPYGIGWYEPTPGQLTVYVTDNYEGPNEATPPDRELGARVKQFRVTFDGGRMRAEHVRSFGDTAGAGVLRVVESIIPDAANNRLLIAEETETDSYIKVYDLEGKFTGTLLGRGDFPQQAEGIALYACADGGGYWITTDQGDTTNTYTAFDRKSLARVAKFSGAKMRRTDGVALTQVAFGPFPSGAFYGSHLDGAIGALSWADVAKATGLRADCTR